MSKLMSNFKEILMSKFRVPIAINIVDILIRNVGRKRRINAVGHSAPGCMPHVSLPVFSLGYRRGFAFTTYTNGDIMCMNVETIKV